MKRCPQCNRVETDEALKFCRVDGATLVSDSSSIEGEAGTEQPASEASEVHTSILPHNTNPGVNRATGPTTTLPTPSVTRTQQLPVTRNRKWLIVAAAAVLLVVVGIAGYWAFERFNAAGKDNAVESIAVLPFENQNRDPDSEYVSDGVTEGIINSLTQLPNLKVIARSSVFRYKGKAVDPLAVGKELGVRAVLTGRIMQRGDTLTVSTELVDVRDNKQIWGEQYIQKVSDLSALPRDIAAKITSNLRLTISGEARNRMLKHYTDNPEAYQLYLKGRYYWNKRNAESLRKAADYFNQAIERDPSYALAYSGLADSYGLLPGYGGGSPQDFYPKAIGAARKALEFDDTLAEAHTSLATMIGSYEWKWGESEKEFKRAIELNPNYATAHHWYSDGPLLATGRFEEANREMKRAQELDPLSLIINTEVGVNYQTERRYDEAIEQLRKTIEMDPNFYFAHWNLALTYDLKGDFSGALKEYQTALQLSDDPMVLGLMGRAYARIGQRAEAMKILEQLKKRSSREYVDPFAFTVLYAALDDKDAAFQWLEKCYQDRCPEITLIKVDPTLDSIRSDRRYFDLLRRVGLS
jgi:TolB-like protein/Tfp pilus assembly protein PilF